MRVVICGSIANAAFAQPQANTPATRLKVIVSIAPQAALVKSLGGDRVDVETLVSPGQSPHVFEPTPQQIARICDARLCVRVGMPFETALLKKIVESNPRLESVDMRTGLSLLEGHEHEHDQGEATAKEQHGESHKHGGAGEIDDDADPHIWLDPKRMKIAAKTISDALRNIDPTGADDYARWLGATERRLTEIDSRLTELLAPYRGRAVFVYHAAYGYFADSYGLRQIAVEAGGKEPTPKELAKLVELAAVEKAKAVFYEPQFSRASVEVLAREINARVVELNDLAPDYFENLERIGREFADALK